MRYNCPCTYHCVGPDLKSTKNRCICANRSALSYSCLRIFVRILFATGERVVCERSVGPDEHVVLKRHSSPQLNTALNRYSIADSHPAFNKDPIAYVAVRAYPRVLENVGEGPNASSFSNRRGFTDRLLVNEILHSGTPMRHGLEQYETHIAQRLCSVAAPLCFRMFAKRRCRLFRDLRYSAHRRKER